uniref:Uncharacterized protein n=1 Tax=Glossina brevipalpis TaxID=37001 RepID=A0A1A9WDP8_9MUSC
MEPMQKQQHLLRRLFKFINSLFEKLIVKNCKIFANQRTSTFSSFYCVTCREKSSVDIIEIFFIYLSLPTMLWMALYISGNILRKASEHESKQDRITIVIMGLAQQCTTIKY